MRLFIYVCTYTSLHRFYIDMICYSTYRIIMCVNMYILYICVECVYIFIYIYICIYCIYIYICVYIYVCVWLIIPKLMSERMSSSHCFMRRLIPAANSSLVAIKIPKRRNLAFWVAGDGWNLWDWLGTMGESLWGSGPCRFPGRYKPFICLERRLGIKPSIIWVWFKVIYLSSGNFV